jgi:hypothetical protein
MKELVMKEVVVSVEDVKEYVRGVIEEYYLELFSESEFVDEEGNLDCYSSDNEGSRRWGRIDKGGYKLDIINDLICNLELYKEIYLDERDN